MRPDSEVGVDAVGSPVFSIAFVAVTLEPAEGASLSTFSFAEDDSGFDVDAGPPILRTFAPPDDSTLGASLLIESTFAFDAVDVPFESVAGFSGTAGVDEGCELASLAEGRFAILG